MLLVERRLSACSLAVSKGGMKGREGASFLYPYGCSLGLCAGLGRATVLGCSEFGLAEYGVERKVELISTFIELGLAEGDLEMGFVSTPFLGDGGG